MELHELISTYILTCRQRGQGGPPRRGRFIRIETSVDDDDGFHFDGPEIRVPVYPPFVLSLLLTMLAN